MDAERFLGVDLGGKRTGIALSDITRTLAGGHLLLTPTGLTDCAKKVSEIAGQYNVSRIIIGNPLNMNGTKGESVKRVETFAKILETFTEAQIILFDERLSTSLAHVYMNATGISGQDRKGKVDMLSAQIILQDYIDSIR